MGAHAAALPSTPPRSLKSHQRPLAFCLLPACFSLVSDLSRLVSSIESRRSGAHWERPVGRIGELTRGGNAAADASVSCSCEQMAVICCCYELLPNPFAAVPANVSIHDTSYSSPRLITIVLIYRVTRPLLLPPRALFSSSRRSLYSNL
jgi:hypothetical protein